MKNFNATRIGKKTSKVRSRQYAVKLSWVQRSEATVIVRARSLQFAKRAADVIQSQDIPDWTGISGELSVESVVFLRRPA